jgi:hypothetical protein
VHDNSAPGLGISPGITRMLVPLLSLVKPRGTYQRRPLIGR